MLNTQDNNTLSHEEFKNKANHFSIDHKRIYRGNNSTLSLDWIFNGRNSKLAIDVEDDIDFTPLKTSIPILDNVPITVIRATSNELQNIFYGPTTSEKINMLRLHKFNNSSFDEKNINWLPHPIG